MENPLNLQTAAKLICSRAVGHFTIHMCGKLQIDAFNFQLLYFEHSTHCGKWYSMLEFVEAESYFLHFRIIAFINKKKHLRFFGLLFVPVLLFRYL